jgi:hypothetical protein
MSKRMKQEYPTDPKKGYQIERCCINCDKTAMMNITKVRKKSINDDGSTCYTIQANCPNCGYENGQYKPMWWNLYRKGSMVW